MRTSWKKRLLVFAMLAAMLAAHAGSFAVLEVYPNHHHTGEHCVICLLTEQAVQTLHHGGPDQPASETAAGEGDVGLSERKTDGLKNQCGKRAGQRPWALLYYQKIQIS